MFLDGMNFFEKNDRCCSKSSILFNPHDSPSSAVTQLSSRVVKIYYIKMDKSQNSLESIPFASDYFNILVRICRLF